MRLLAAKGIVVLATRYATGTGHGSFGWSRGTGGAVNVDGAILCVTYSAAARETFLCIDWALPQVAFSYSRLITPPRARRSGVVGSRGRAGLP